MPTLLDGAFIEKGYHREFLICKPSILDVNFNRYLSI